ncbi:MAG: ornithine carbamoyltransferase [Rickettsiales bacterium]|nr:ornithine carbamoyltransferase [Rickettsiales bacterium]
MDYNKNNFLNLSDLNISNLNKIIKRAINLKKLRFKKKPSKKSLDGINLAMIFEKPSTRTRVSFEIAIKELGGQVVILDESNTHLARGETISDTSRVLDRYCQIFMIRTNDHNKLLEYSQHAKAPIINGLSNISHPCQVLADIMTFQEKKGKIEKKNITWIGDINNVLYSWIEASNIFGFNLKIVHPKEIRANKNVIDISRGKKNITFTNKIDEATNKSDCIVTDTWFSMGNKKSKKIEKYFLPYQVNKKLLKEAKKNVIFMHCLPATRNKEVTNDIIENKNISVVWDEAENRLHIQKAILEWCMNKI